MFGQPTCIFQPFFNLHVYEQTTVKAKGYDDINERYFTMALKEDEEYLLDGKSLCA